MSITLRIPGQRRPHIHAMTGYFCYRHCVSNDKGVFYFDCMLLTDLDQRWHNMNDAASCIWHSNTVCKKGAHFDVIVAENHGHLLGWQKHDADHQTLDIYYERPWTPFVAPSS